MLDLIRKFIMTFLCVDFIDSAQSFDSSENKAPSTQSMDFTTVEWCFYRPLQILNRINYSSYMPGTLISCSYYMRIGTNGIEMESILFVYILSTIVYSSIKIWTICFSQSIAFLKINLCVHYVFMNCSIYDTSTLLSQRRNRFPIMYNSRYTFFEERVQRLFFNYESIAIW